MRSFVAAIIFAATVLATPSTRARYCSDSLYDTYDQPPSEIGGGLLPSAANIGTTAGGALAYTGWVYSDQVLSNDITLLLPSGDGAAGHNALTELPPLNKPQPSWSPLAPYAYFDQSYICAACIIAKEVPAASLAVSCSIQFTGVSYATGKTAVEVLQFTPQPLPTEFACTEFPDTFRGLRSVSVQLLQDPLPEVLTVMLIDNNTYTAYEKC